MEASSSTRTLEVTVLSADNLCVGPTLPTNNAFVVIRAESLNSFTTGMASVASEGGNGRFSWNDKFLVDLPAHAMSITFEVKSKTAMGVVKNVGMARIALSDLLRGGSTPAELQRYRLRDWDGRPSGVINFTVKIPEYSSSSSIGKPAAAMTMTEKVSSCGFQMRASMTPQRNCNGVVIGVPVYWNNYTI